jgi:hypothetical protein
VRKRARGNNKTEGNEIAILELKEFHPSMSGNHLKGTVSNGGSDHDDGEIDS